MLANLVEAYTMKQTITLENLLEKEALSETQLSYLENSLNQQKNILITGTIGSGKTTVVKEIVNRIPKDSTIVTVEYIQEINSDRKDIIQFDSREMDIDRIFSGIYKFGNKLDYVVFEELDTTQWSKLLTLMQDLSDKSYVASLHSTSPQYALSKILFNCISDMSQDYVIKGLKNFDFIIHNERLDNGEYKMSFYEIGEYNLKKGEFDLIEIV